MSGEEDVVDLIQHLHVLRLQPGDTLVLKHHAHLSEEIRTRLLGAMAEVLPGHRMIVLEGGMDLGVVRRGEPGAEP